MSSNFSRPPSRPAPKPPLKFPVKPAPPTHHAYSEIPTLAQWETYSPLDTAPSPPRKQDAALAVVDELVSALERAESHGEICYRLAELFFATMWWMNHHRQQPWFRPGSDATRRTAVLSLNLCAANKLATTLMCPIGELASTLQKIYGVEMVQHGINCDGPGGSKGGYLKDADRERSRVIFRNGLAYRFSDLSSAPNPAKPAGDAQIQLWDTDEGLDHSGRAGYLFVMSVSGDLFVRRMSGSTTFHSSFTQGRPVACAGTICIEHGKITRICNDSGHYQPMDTAMVKVLQRLRLAGVNLAAITVVDQRRLGQTKNEMGQTYFRPLQDWYNEVNDMDIKAKDLKLRESEYQDAPGFVREIRGDLFLVSNGNWETIRASGAGHHGGAIATGMKLNPFQRTPTPFDRKVKIAA